MKTEKCWAGLSRTAGVELDAKSNIVKLHKNRSETEYCFCYEKDSEKEESYFVHKLNDLMEIGGHYTYYEKNPCMQNYMIAARRKNRVSPSETVEDHCSGLSEHGPQSEADASEKTTV